MSNALTISHKSTTLLDQYGQPLARTEQNQPIKRGSGDGSFTPMSFSSYFASLYGLSQDAVSRSMSPFENHAWVYAGAMAIALNISQARFNVYNETDTLIAKRRDAVIRKNGKWMGPPAGRERQAVRRHLAKASRRQGVPIGGGIEDTVEENLTHPLVTVLSRPNDFMTESQLWQATALWQVLKGSCMWLCMTESGDPLPYGTLPEVIIPLPPNFFRPVIIGNKLIAWRYRVPVGLGQGHSGATLYLDVNEVIQFKFFNEADFIAGFAPIASSASAIAQDMLAVENTKSTLINGSDPGGVLYAENGFEDEAEETKFLKKWEQRHQGTFNKSRTAIISGGVKYVQTGLSPQDMQWVEMRKWNREEILAVMGVPKTCVGVTDDIVYATQMAQDKNFWDKRLFPMLRNEEDVIDCTLLFNEPDSTFAGFDVSGIESLRTGYDTKINEMKVLTGPEIHMPPRQAAQVVGLDLPSYPGDDRALIAPTLRPADDVIADSQMISDMISGNGDGTGSRKPKEKPLNDGEPDTPPAGTGGDNAKRIQRLHIEMNKANKIAFWTRYVAELQFPVEINFKIAWRKTMAASRSSNLMLFDRSVHIDGNKSSLISKVSDAFSVDSVILPTEELAAFLRNYFDPVYLESIQKIYDFMVEELGGINSFTVGSAAVQAAIKARLALLLGTVPQTVQEIMRKSLIEGVQAGETIQQLRTRVAETYDNASASKTLQVARTESNSFIAEIRERVFEAEELDQGEWIDAGDEQVREHHHTFGTSGPRPMKFNYLTLVGGAGILQYPGDSRAPAEEVVSCRCVKIAV